MVTKNTSCPSSGYLPQVFKRTRPKHAPDFPTSQLPDHLYISQRILFNEGTHASGQQEHNKCYAITLWHLWFLQILQAYNGLYVGLFQRGTKIRWDQRERTDDSALQPGLSQTRTTRKCFRTAPWRRVLSERLVYKFLLTIEFFLNFDLVHLSN